MPGLCYPYAFLSDSIFNLIPGRSAEDQAVVSHLAPRPLFTVSNIELPPDHNWRQTLQGLTVSRTMSFLTEIEAARFRTPKGVWRIRPKRVTVSDPFNVIRTADIWFLLPETSRDRLQITKTLDDGSVLIERSHA